MCIITEVMPFVKRLRSLPLLLSEAAPSSAGYPDWLSDVCSHQNWNYLSLLSLRNACSRLYQVDIAGPSDCRPLSRGNAEFYKTARVSRPLLAANVRG